MVRSQKASHSHSLSLTKPLPLAWILQEGASNFENNNFTLLQTTGNYRFVHIKDEIRERVDVYVSILRVLLELGDLSSVDDPFLKLSEIE